jgi:hypothetical protein
MQAADAALVNAQDAIAEMEGTNESREIIRALHEKALKRAGVVPAY